MKHAASSGSTPRRATASGRGWRWAGLAVALALGAAWLARSGMEAETATPPPATPAGRGDPAALWTWGIGGDTETAKPAAGPVEAGIRLFSSGSLAGTEAAGNWCVVEDERLEPCRGLRDRFDYYLLGLGEASLEALGELVEADAARVHGPALAARIAAVWKLYLEATAYQPRTVLELTDQASRMAFHAELQAARRRILGPEWAAAFFADEEQEFQAWHARLEAGLPTPPDPGAPVPQLAPEADPASVHAERAALYGEAAAQRLARLDEDWADWEHRLAAARDHWNALQRSPQLSDLQRREDIDRYVREHFSPGEHRRIRALLRL